MATAPGIVRCDAAYFESIYAEAEGNATLLSWGDGHPSPALVNWLNAVAPSLVRCGSRVAVVGCGLGEDARALIRRGYDVTAFDCSPTAIEWARRDDPESADSYVVADLFMLPPRWRHRFDLVVEVNTVQSIEPDRHLEAIHAMSSLLGAHGHLLVVCRGSDSAVDVAEGPPWPLTQRELLEAATLGGLVLVDDAMHVFLDDEAPAVQRIRALFRRA